MFEFLERLFQKKTTRLSRSEPHRAQELKTPDSTTGAGETSVNVKAQSFDPDEGLSSASQSSMVNVNEKPKTH